MNARDTTVILESALRLFAQSRAKRRFQRPLTTADLARLRQIPAVDRAEFAEQQALNTLFKLLADLEMEIDREKRATAFERVTLGEVVDVDPIEMAERNAEVPEVASSFRVIGLTPLEGEAL